MIAAGRDFASLLDELLQDHEPAAAPTPFAYDYLDVADELLSGDIKIAPEFVAASYGEFSESLRKEAEDVLSETEILVDDPEILPVDRDSIAGELGLASGVPVSELDRLRRLFAFRNHPDRVKPSMRQQALARMQMANMLIDEAKHRSRSR